MELGVPGCVRHPPRPGKVIGSGALSCELAVAPSGPGAEAALLHDGGSVGGSGGLGILRRIVPWTGRWADFDGVRVVGLAGRLGGRRLGVAIAGLSGEWAGSRGDGGYCGYPHHPHGHGDADLPRRRGSGGVGDRGLGHPSALVFGVLRAGDGCVGAFHPHGRRHVSCGFGGSVGTERVDARFVLGRGSPGAGVSGAGGRCESFITTIHGRRRCGTDGGQEDLGCGASLSGNFVRSDPVAHSLGRRGLHSSSRGDPGPDQRPKVALGHRHPPPAAAGRRAPRVGKLIRALER